MSHTLIVPMILGAAIALIVGGYLFVNREQESLSADIAFPEAGREAAPEQPQLQAPVIPAGWQLFENQQYGFSVYVPPGIKVMPFDEGGAHTFSFENAETAEGFQVFVVPYSDTTISRERFLQDSPSGVMKEPVDITVGGGRATTFFGEHAILGETREVWILHGGLLFEVTSYKHLDAWLMKILDTWRFTR